MSDGSVSSVGGGFETVYKCQIDSLVESGADILCKCNSQLRSVFVPSEDARDTIIVTDDLDANHSLTQKA